MKLIKQIRKSLGITQETLARRAGLKQEVIARLERDSYTNPRLLTVKRVLAAMGYEFHIETLPKNTPLTSIEKRAFKALGVKTVVSAGRYKKSFRAIL